MLWTNKGVLSHSLMVQANLKTIEIICLLVALTMS